MITIKNNILKQYFGYDCFRDGQEFLIDNILNGKDVLGVMPTGAGKSICFQVPALLLDGITLVISPLISLMKDQVNALTQAGVKAAYINSSLTEKQYYMVIEKAKAGIYKIIYVAPERLLNYEFLEFAQKECISMITIDEAHCISQWGQDFRPSYLKIIDFVNSLKVRPVISAFTATATEVVRDDIIRSLNLNNYEILVTGFDRENLYFEVQKPVDKYKALLRFLDDKKDKSGVIYAMTRKLVEQISKKLVKDGYSATRYHAGLSDAERQINQDDFIFDRSQIIVATNAFGMGIDKSNVGFVVHYNMPKNIESYYQEAGRAGRDGESADCVLLFSGQDIVMNNFFIDNNKDSDYKDLETERLIKEKDRKRLKDMTNYCYTNNCLREYILKYFGDKGEKNCGNCSNCNQSFKEADITVEAQKILSCVIRVKQRFGIKMIVDILRGVMSEKIVSNEFHNLSTFNIISQSETRTRDMIDFLIQNEYLKSTDSEFPVLEIGSKGNEILKDKKIILMKLAEDYDETQTYFEDIKKANHKSKSKTKSTNNKPVDNNLMEALKQKRLEISKEQNVPAFVIFSNSTLTDMCMKMPKTDQEFMDVSGVGEFKLEKYGQAFIKLIKDFEDGTLDKTMNNSDKKEIPVDHRNDHLLIVNQVKHITVEITEDLIPVSWLADNISTYLIQKNKDKISSIKLNKWLVEKGYLEVVTSSNGENKKIPTAKGLELGITSKTTTNSRGDEYESILYNKAAQESIVEQILKEVK